MSDPRASGAHMRQCSPVNPSGGKNQIKQDEARRTTLRFAKTEERKCSSPFRVDVYFSSEVLVTLALEANASTRSGRASTSTAPPLEDEDREGVGDVPHLD